jgi:hypothetical protein
MDNANVSLTISKDVVNPIVEAKIKEAILAALGGSEKLIAHVVDSVLRERVGADGKRSTYSSDNKYDWLDIVVSKQIEAAVRDELTKQISESSQEIKDALITALRTKKGASVVANALLAGMEKTFAQSWTSAISIEIKPNKV